MRLCSLICEHRPPINLYINLLLTTTAGCGGQQKVGDLFHFRIMSSSEKVSKDRQTDHGRKTRGQKRCVTGCSLRDSSAALLIHASRLAGDPTSAAGILQVPLL